MALIPCPECGRQISTAAEACPQCGHPTADFQEPEAPRCYRCSAAATTRCQSCGALSCALHVQSIYVTHGRGGSYELRCESCYSSAMVWKVVGFVVFAVILVIVLLFWMGVFK